MAPRLAHQREALAAVQESPVAHPVVTLVHPKMGQASSELLLPGNIQPLYSAAVYARTKGYIERRNVDIGSKVKAGDVLAVISSPEVDQQLLQARATLAQSEASLEQAKAALGQAKANAELAALPKSAICRWGSNTRSLNRSSTSQCRLTMRGWRMSLQRQQTSRPLRPT